MNETAHNGLAVVTGAAGGMGAAVAARLAAALAGTDIGVFIHTAGLSPTMADAERILRVNFDATCSHSARCA